MALNAATLSSIDAFLLVVDFIEGVGEGVVDGVEDIIGCIAAGFSTCEIWLSAGLVVS